MNQKKSELPQRQENKNITKVLQSNTNISSSFKLFPSPLDFDTFVPWFCQQLQLSIEVNVKRKMKNDIILQSPNRSSRGKESLKSSKTKLETIYRNESIKELTDISNTTVTSTNNALFINAYYDNKNQLVEIAFINCQIDSNAKVIQVLNVCLPFHPFLYRLIIKRSLTHIVLHETSKLLSNISNITDLCLDDNFVPEGNYYVLLDHLSHIQNLSLKRCNINDEVCIKIADKLNLESPASKTLHTLDLGSNNITDVGAEFLGKMLRTNRALLYLNIADNLITDKGATYILNNLLCFALTKDEVIARNLKLLDYYLMKSNKMYNACENEIMTRFRNEEKENICTRNQLFKQERDVVKIRRNSFCSDSSTILDPAEKRGKENDEFKDVFGQNIVRRDGLVYARGNFRLSYLNLAYNNLGYFTIRKLFDVLRYQSNVGKTFECRGLLKIILEGNNMPKFSQEWHTIETLLESAISGSALYNTKKKSSTTKSQKKNHQKKI